jgi:hypothetical protein
MSERLVVIEDSIITSILSNPRILAAIPALKTAADIKNPGSPRCTPCARKARARAANYSQVKTTISNLRGEALAKLKQELNADKLRVLFKNTAGKLVQITL